MNSKNRSELKVITVAKNLCSYVMTATNKSPKNFRFTFVSRMQNLSLDIIENLYRANEVFIKDRKPDMLQKRLNFQSMALTNIKILSYMAFLACEQNCLLRKQYEQIAKLCTDCQYLLGAWMKSGKWS